MSPPERSAERDTPADATSSTRAQLLVVGALYALAAVVYLLLARRQEMPIVTPDEFNYGRVARSIADGDGKTLLGAPYELRSALYLYVIAPAWLGDSTTAAYGIAKAIGALLVCLTVVPTWLLARSMLSRRTALVPTALVLAGTWMTTAALILTENLALPLTAASLTAMVAALRAPGSRWGWIALALALVGTWARMQCIVLVPILFGSLLLRAALARPGFRARLDLDLKLATVTGVLTLGGSIVGVANPDILGSYVHVVDIHPGAADIASAVGHQGIGLAAMTAILPVLVVLAGSLRRASWAEDDLAALLVVTWIATAVFVLESAWLVTAYGTWHVQRYVEYVVPLLLVAMTVLVDRRKVAWRDLAAATGLVAVLLFLATPPLRNVGEERGAFALGHRLDQLLGASLPTALSLVTLLVGGAAAAVLARTDTAEHRRSPVLALGAVVLLVLVVQSQAIWSWQAQRVADKRAVFPREDVAWIDRATSDPVAGLIVTVPSALWLETSFFNRRVTEAYAPSGRTQPEFTGRVCPWGVDKAGYLQFDPGCGEVRRHFLANDPLARTTFYGQSTVVGNRVAGRLITVPARPRMLAVVQMPCPLIAGPPVKPNDEKVAIADLCFPTIRASLWLDRPGTLLLRFLGADTVQSVTFGSHTLAIPPGTLSAVRIPLPRGASTVPIALSWKGPSPALVSAVLVQGTTRTPLL